MPKITNNADLVEVSLGDRSYPIVISQGLLKDKNSLQSLIPNQQICFISNETIAPLYLDALMAQFPNRTIAHLILPDGEHFKTLETLSKIFDLLMSKQMDRKAALVALGGGVICDMTGFAAACYRRGIDFYQVPTTLLAQVDAAVGGKTAVNHPLGKNMIGAFYQPKAVIIDIDTLNTLADREFKAGLAEVLKYGFIKDKSFLNWLKAHRPAILKGSPEALKYIIKHSCTIKANIVAKDETEQGERALLNFGHSFGHALEAATHYKQWLHGEAVAIGMAAAGFLSWQLGLLAKEDYESLVQLIKDFGLPITQQQAIPAAVLKNYLLQDKKILWGQLRLILLNALGEACISTDFTEEALLNTLKQI